MTEVVVVITRAVFALGFMTVVTVLLGESVNVNFDTRVLFSLGRVGDVVVANNARFQRLHFFIHRLFETVAEDEEGWEC